MTACICLKPLSQFERLWCHFAVASGHYGLIGRWLISQLESLLMANTISSQSCRRCGRKHRASTWCQRPAKSVHEGTEKQRLTHSLTDWQGHLTDWLSHWPTDPLTDWQTNDRTTDSLPDQPIHFVTYSLTHLETDRLTYWQTDSHTHFLSYSLTHTLTDSVNQWHNGRLNHSQNNRFSHWRIDPLTQGPTHAPTHSITDQVTHRLTGWVTHLLIGWLAQNTHTHTVI